MGGQKVTERPEISLYNSLQKSEPNAEAQNSMLDENVCWVTTTKQERTSEDVANTLKTSTPDGCR